MLRNLMDSTGSPQEEFSLPAIEEKVLAYWRANRVFEKSLALRQAQGKKYKRFVFFEGPPTANGRPGIHHVLARAFKDIVLRYKTMRGFYVPRKSGFDTHGLPVEIEVEKELGLKSKKEIEKFGIAEFNKKCKESTLKYKDEWERLTERMGFWLDLKNPYLTYENRYMETVWWILKEVWKKKLLYRGHKVVPWCPRCGTTLSSHELALGYEEVEDTSVYVKFYAPKLRAYILSWTTTPWTLPGNVALAVNPNVTYVKAKVGKELYILAKECLSVITEPHEIVDEMKGKELVGVAYEPLFDVSALKSKTSYKIYPASFVTTEDGTGVVHTAVMYGEDDYQLGMKVGLPARHTVDEAGKFMADVKGFAGLYVKAPETEKKILGHLEKKGLLFKTEKYSHEYPFCWRCQTPLLYYARDSWFIAMSKLRAKLLSENKKINWVPAHLREGRFGEWLREVKDWAISRSRYWGTPLPIWQCEKCEATEVLGGREEIGKRLGNHGNRYLLVRHGFAENNLKGIVSGWPERAMHHLTLEGRVEVERLAKRLLKENATVIYASDITRTKETAAILAKALRITKIQHDARLREVNTGEFSELHVADYRGFFTSEREQFTKRPEGGETLSDVRVRVWDFLREIDAKHRGKTILIVSHQYPIWMLEMTMRGWSEDESLAAKEEGGKDFVATGSAHEVPFRSLPRDTTGAADFHRPYVDEVTFSCTKCGAKMKRVPEVLDVWFDSGAMPFAQAHWPFAQTEKLTTNNQQLTYPADYISEGLDQTRGWFYTLLAIGILMGRGRSYKNVYVQGILLDKFGKKMSKSKGNAVDPWAMIQKYGIDAVRWFIYTGTRPGESIIFDEANVGKTLRQFIILLYHSYLFYETYADKSANSKGQSAKSGNILDRWILARLEETKDVATKSLEKYEAGNAARAIEAFVGDLSRWYIRRSRRRLQKPDPSADGQKEYRDASQTLKFVLVETTKLLAPFVPFFAEALYLSLFPARAKGKVESVHLSDWPRVNSKLKTKNSKLIKEMDEVRRLASIGLAKRAESGIKVRQPLASMTVKSRTLKGKKEFLALLADEVNVKMVKVDPKAKEDMALDTKITHELQEEGWFRELVRTVQGMRQDAKLTPKDAIVAYLEVPPELAHVVKTREKEFAREVNAKSVEFAKVHKHNVELSTKIDEWPVWLAVKKV